MERNTEAEHMEKSIRKKFHKELFSPFARAVRDYKLIQEGDNIAVCISGGKDSMLMAKLFQELQKHRKVSFDLKFLVMDPGYLEANRNMIEANGARMGVPLTVFESDIFEAVQECAEDTSIIRPGSWAAIKLHWAIITMMSSRQF